MYGKIYKSFFPLLLNPESKADSICHNPHNTKPLGKVLLVLLALFYVSEISANSPQITIVWSTENYDQSASVLSNASGEFLDAGVQGNGDGDLVELGYYSLASTDNPFLGEWIPLSLNTRVGDSSTGYGFDHGKFAFTSTFTKDESTVTVFPTEPKVFIETLDFEITATSPPPGTPICIRFYDSPTKTADTKYNAVTGENWRWPTFPTGSSVPSNYYWKIASGTPPSGSFWKYGNTFESDANPYKTMLSESFNLGVKVSENSVTMGNIDADYNNTYDAGTHVQINATPNEHYEFYQWIGGTFTDLWNANTSVLIDKNLNIQAEFKPKIYTVSVPEQWVEYVSGEGPYDYNTPVSLSVPFPPEGYEVRAWEENSLPVAEGPVISFNIDSNRLITPVFTPVNRDISITSSYGGSITTYDANGTIVEEFYHDQNYTIILSPNPYFEFSGWSAESSGTEMLTAASSESSLIYKLTVSGDALLQATFAPRQNYLAITGGTGTDSLFPASNMYLADSTIQVTSTPKVGYQFDYWQDPQGILSDTTIPVTEANISKINVSAEITANFRIIDYNSSLIDISSGSGGTYILSSDSDNKYSHFSQYTLRAIPDPGYQFSHWSGDKNQSNLSKLPNVADNSLIIDGPLTLEAVFVPSTYTLIASVSPEEAGYVEGTGGFSLIDSLKITAQPYPFWEFAGWTGDTELLVSPDSPESVLQFTNDEDLRDINLTALFTRQTYNFTANSEENGEVVYSVTSDNFVHHSNSNHFKVSGGQSSSPYFDFTNFTDEIPDFDFLSLHRGETYIFSANGIDTAHSFMIGEEYGDLDSELVTGTSLTGPDGNITVTIPIDFDGNLYYFCSVPGHSSMFKQFLVTDAPTLSNTSNAVRNIAHLTYKAEDRITVEGIPDQGWKFKKWNGLPYDEAIPISPSSFDPYVEFSQFDGYGDLNITAQFERKSYNLVITDVLGGGSFQGHGVYLYEDNVNISAQAAPHYEFIEWTGEDSNLLHFNRTIPHNSLDIPARDVTISALFRPKTYTLSAISEGNGSIDFYSIWDDHNTSIPSDIKGTSLVVINTTPNPGYVLASLEWNSSYGLEGVSYSNEFVIPSMDGNYSFVASFKEPPNDLSYNLVNQSPLRGIIEDNSAKASLNQRTFLATSLSNHSFLGWTFSPDPNPSPHFTAHEINANISEGMVITAHFSETPSHTFVEYNSTRGIIEKELSGNLSNKRIELNATPLDNYTFSSWEILKSFDYNVTRNFSSVDQSHSRLFINGVESPELKLVRGHTYKFTNNLDNDEHIYFSTQPFDDYAERILEGISENQGPNEVIFTVPLDGPDSIYYNGSISSFSGNKIEIINLDEENLIPYPSNISINFSQDIDLGILAHFTPIELEVEVSTTGEGDVSLNQNDNFRYGDLIQVNASPKQHWEFSHWESNIEILTPDSPDINLTLSQDTELIAVFDQKKYDLQISSYPASFGNAYSINNKYKFHYGDTVQIKAVAKNGKNFVSWSGANFSNESSTENSFVIDGHTNLIANFEANQYFTENTFIVLDKNDQILPNENPGEIIGSSTAFDEEIITLSLNLDEGYQFISWQDGDTNISLSSDPFLSRKIQRDTKTQAIVRKLSYQIKVTSYPQNTGTVIWNDQIFENYFELSVDHGDEVYFFSNPNTGYKFKNWMSSSGTLPFPFSTSINFAADRDMQVAAYFEPISDLNLSIIIEPAEAGWSVGSGTFQLNESHSILAIPNKGWLFDRWIGNNINDSDSASTTLNLQQDSTIYAEFVVDPDYSPSDGDSNSPDPTLNVLIVSPDNPTEGNTTGSGYYEDTWVNITATPANNNYVFSYWQGMGGVNIEDPLSATTRVYVNKDTEVSAHFEYVSNEDHILFVSANNAEYGKVYGGGSFRDSWASIRAVPNNGYSFAGWEGQGIMDLFSAETQIFVNSTKEAVAYFEPSSIFNDSVKLDSNWWKSPWFGYYWKSSSSQWTYHSKLSWIHIRKKSDNSIWIWIDKLNGWFWSGEPHFPYLYSSNMESSSWYWLNLERSSPQQILIYKFGESSGWKSY